MRLSSPGGDDQGRVQAAQTLIAFSGGWLGPLVVGLLLERAGVSATVLALAGWSLLLAVATTASRAFRNPPTVPELAVS